METPFHSEEMDTLLSNMAEDELRAFAQALGEPDSDDSGQIKLLGSVYFFAFLKTGAIADLEQGIKTEERVAAMSVDHDQVTSLNRLSHMLAARHGHTNEMKDLVLAIHWAEGAVKATPVDNANYVPHLRTLTLMLFKRYEQTNSAENLQQAILTAEEAVFNTPPVQPDRTGPLEFLATALSKRYKQTGSMEELQQAILLANEALAAKSNEPRDSGAPMIELIRSLEKEVVCKGKQAANITSKDHAELANMLHQRGFMLLGRFQQTQKMKDLDEAIHTVQQAVDVAQGGGQRAGYLTNLGNMLMRRFERTKKLEDLEEAIRKAEQAVEASSEGDPYFTGFLNNLCFKLKVRYEETRKVEDLEEAISKAERAIEITPKGHPTLVALQTNFGSMLMRKFELTNRMEDIEGAIHNTEQAIEATFESGPDLIGLQNNLSTMLGARFSQTGDIDDLERAIRSMKEVISATPKEYLAFSGYQGNLANLCMSRFKHTRKWEDLEEANYNLRQAVAAVPKGGQNQAGCLNQLSRSFAIRFELTGITSDLDEAIEAGEQAVNTAPEWQPDLADWLSALSLLYKSRFERTGSIEDLERAINNAERATDATPEHHHDCPRRWSILGAFLSARFEETDRIDDLHEAIRKGEQAVSIASEGHADVDLADLLSILSRMLKTRFERTENEEDLETAINNAALAVGITPKKDPKLSYHQINLGSALLHRFRLTGRIEDLEEAISNGEQAVNAIPEGKLSHAENRAYVGYRVCLGNWLHARFGHKGRIEDLEAAIHQTVLAVQGTPEGDPSLGMVFNNLSHMLEERGKRTNTMEDLDEAIHKAKQAVNATPKEHPDLPNFRNSLSSYLTTRFEKTGRTQDLEDAILNMKQVVDVTTEGHPRLRDYLHNLSTMLMRRFELMGRAEDIEEAIRHGERALDAAPERHPQRATFLENLGQCLSQSPHPSHRGRAVESFLKGWECQSGMPLVRVQSARQAIQLLEKKKEWNQASTIAKQVVSLLPIMNNRSLNRDDQQHIVSRFSGLAADACSLALEVGDSPFQALELLELGRGVILGLLMDDRSDLSELRAYDPEKAAKFEKLRDAVNAPIQDAEGSKNSLTVMNQRLKAFRDLDNCLQEIRQLPGHDRFQLGLTEDEAKECAGQGPIVVVNITSIRTDAIIVTTSNIDAVSLPELTMANVSDWLQKNLIAYEDMDEFRTKNVQYREFQTWLWSKCVKPILAKLENGQKPSRDSLPRVWWIGVGVASFLPFHAAGTYTLGSVENTHSRIISSYVPTIKALAHARKSAQGALEFSNDKPKLLIVTMPTTPGERPLLGVGKEVSEVQRVVDDTFSVQSLVQPAAREVLSQLKEYDVVHFACHGVSDFMDPSNSSLLLQRSQGLQSKPELDRLTVRQVSAVNLKKAKIAYLSACSTAQNLAVQLADEVIHLASGFQVAGFGHVIGSMWPSDDGVCIDVAKEFYEQLRLSDFHIQGSNKAVAAALHASLTKVLSKKRKLPLLWAQYIHLGA